MTGTGRRVATLALLAVTTTGCVGPTTSDAAVRRQAVLSTEAAASELSTADLAVRTQLAGEAWWPYTDVVVTAAEGTVSTVEQTFASRQPPRTTGPLYVHTGDALGRAADLVTDLRLAVRREDTAELRRLLRDVRPVLRRLDAVARSAR